VAREGFAVVSGTCPDSIIVERQTNCTVVSLSGEHDIETLDELSEAMARGIAWGDAEVVVDLSGVEFMSAASAAVRVRGRDLLCMQSRELTVRSPSRSAHRLLEVCGLTGLVLTPQRNDVVQPRLYLVTSDRR
jgi:anti-anti-sigma factor